MVNDGNVCVWLKGSKFDCLWKIPISAVIALFCTAESSPSVPFSTHLFQFFGCNCGRTGSLPEWPWKKQINNQPIMSCQIVGFGLWMFCCSTKNPVFRSDPGFEGKTRCHHSCCLLSVNSQCQTLTFHLTGHAGIWPAIHFFSLLLFLVRVAANRPVEKREVTVFTREPADVCS